MFFWASQLAFLVIWGFLLFINLITLSILWVILYYKFSRYFYVLHVDFVGQIFMDIINAKANIKINLKVLKNNMELKFSNH
jgi:hypothetical protein